MRRRGVNLGLYFESLNIRYGVVGIVLNNGSFERKKGVGVYRGSAAKGKEKRIVTGGKQDELLSGTCWRQNG